VWDVNRLESSKPSKLCEVVQVVARQVEVAHSFLQAKDGSGVDEELLAGWELLGFNVQLSQVWDFVQAFQHNKLVPPNK